MPPPSCAFSALVKGLLVLLGCSLFVAELLLTEPDHRRLAGAGDVSALCVCVPSLEAMAPVVPCKLLVSQCVRICMCVWVGISKRKQNSCVAIETKNFPSRHVGIAVNPLTTHGQPLTKPASIRLVGKAKTHTWSLRPFLHLLL